VACLSGATRGAVGETSPALSAIVDAETRFDHCQSQACRFSLDILSNRIMQVRKQKFSPTGNQEMTSHASEKINVSSWGKFVMKVKVEMKPEV